MSHPIRVLIADKSSAMRRVVSETLSRAGGIDVIGAACDGREALSLTHDLKPDVVILDNDLPGLTGEEVLRLLRASQPKLPIIMFSSLSLRGIDATFHSLSSGATDFVAKPVAAGHVLQAVRHIESQLLPKVQHWGSLKLGRFVVPGTETTAHTQRQLPVRPSVPTKSAARGRPQRIEAVVMGISTGGPNALAEVVPKFPADLGVPILIVQHMPPMFTRLLAERLDQLGPLSVREAVPQAEVRPGQIWIAPGDYHMTVRRQGDRVLIDTNQNERENSCRPSADVLFRSAAEVWGGNMLGVIMTGMGKDGLEGCRCIRPLGANIVCQDEASCVVWGMPRAVTEAGLADHIVGLKNMADEIVRQVRIANKTLVPAGAV